MQFINETVRLANIVPGIFRKALRDVHFKGMHRSSNFPLNPSFFFSALYYPETYLNIEILICVGYTIPAGWGVMVCPPAVHLNPAKYENPLHFNPWRWEVKQHLCDFCHFDRPLQVSYYSQVININHLHIGRRN